MYDESNSKTPSDIRRPTGNAYYILLQHQVSCSHDYGCSLVAKDTEMAQKWGTNGDTFKDLRTLGHPLKTMARKTCPMVLFLCFTLW